jgi:hypothetical protein
MPANRSLSLPITPPPRLPEPCPSAERTAIGRLRYTAYRGRNDKCASARLLHPVALGTGCSPQIAFACGPGASETRYGAGSGGWLLLDAQHLRISARLRRAGAGRIHMGAGFGVQPPPAHAFRRTAAHVFDLLAVRMPAHTSDVAIRGIWPSQALERGTVQIGPGDHHMPFLIGSKAGRSR